jgi:hypothetical protein
MMIYKKLFLLSILIVALKSCQFEHKSRILRYYEKHNLLFTPTKSTIFIPIKGCPCLSDIKKNPPQYFYDTLNFNIIFFGTNKMDTSDFNPMLLKKILFIDSTNSPVKVIGISKIFLSIVNSDSVTEYNARNMIKLADYPKEFL